MSVYVSCVYILAVGISVSCFVMHVILYLCIVRLNSGCVLRVYVSCNVFMYRVLGYGLAMCICHVLAYGMLLFIYRVYVYMLRVFMYRVFVFVCLHALYRVL